MNQLNEMKSAESDVCSGIKIIHEIKAGEPFLVVQKPALVPSAPLSPADKNCALFQAARLFPEVMNVRGKKAVEGGLLHRIDTATSGLLLIAASQEFYDFIESAQKEGRFVKHYSAFCDAAADNAEKLGSFPKFNCSVFDGKKPFGSGSVISSYFRKFGAGGREVRPVTEESGRAALNAVSAGRKIYSTKIISLEQNGNAAVLRCSISEGFRHQVRCHLAWAGFPVSGDMTYNYTFRSGSAGLNDLNGNCGMKFFADGLEFPDLYSSKIHRFYEELLPRQLP